MLKEAPALGHPRGTHGDWAVAAGPYRLGGIEGRLPVEGAAWRAQPLACDEVRGKYKDRLFYFESRNQMNPAERLQCVFERGDTTVTMQHTPFW